MRRTSCQVNPSVALASFVCAVIISSTVAIHLIHRSNLICYLSDGVGFLEVASVSSKSTSNRDNANLAPTFFAQSRFPNPTTSNTVSQTRASIHVNTTTNATTVNTQQPYLHYPPGRKYVVPGIQPIVGQHRRDVDAVFCVAKGFGIGVFFTFIESLLNTGFKGDIVIGMNLWNKIPANLKAYLQYRASTSALVVYEIGGCNKNPDRRKVRCKMDDVYIDPKNDGIELLFSSGTSSALMDHPKIIDVAGRWRIAKRVRYEYYWIWSQHYDPQTSRILLADARDLYFQLNPFEHSTVKFQNDERTSTAPTTVTFEAAAALAQKNRPVDYKMSQGSIQLFEENLARSLSQSPVNKKWIRELYSDSLLDQIGDLPRICSGVTIGGVTAIQQYLLLMLYDIDNTQGTPLTHGDQAVHNALVYTAQLHYQMGIDNVQIVPNRVGIVSTNGKDEPLGGYNNETRLVYNDDGTVSPIVHQFDRSDVLTNLVEEKLKKYRHRVKSHLPN